MPGPGSYDHVDLETIKQKGPQFSLAKSDRPKDLFINVQEGSQFYAQSTDEFPGPGHYQIDDAVSKVKPRSRSVAVSKTTKDIDYNNKIPGPGSYENDTLKLKNKNPEWSMSKTNRDDPILTEKEKKELSIKMGMSILLG